MKFYVDTADRTEAQALLQTGLFEGLTTNPALLARAGIRNANIPEVVDWASDAGAKTVFVQAWGSTTAELIDRGRWISSLGGRVVVKVPATAFGLEATAVLTGEGTKVLVTAVYSQIQALPALAAGADFIAPYLGRMNDAGLDGHAEIVGIQESIQASESPMRVLVASLREPRQASDLARIGVTDFTLSPAAWHRFFIDPLTAAAVDSFNADSAGMN